MRDLGMTHEEIAVEFARRCRLRPRAAHRLAHGWTQQQAADRVNAHAARTGLDPDGAATMTSVTDMDLVERACEGVDAVVHLAGYSREASWLRILEVNVGGAYTVFEAARRRGVGRVVFASSMHAAGYAPLPEDGEVSESVCPRPDGNYGVGKAVGEMIGSLYADRYGLDVVCVRIGVCFGDPGHPRLLGRWLSADDCGRLFEACLTAPAPGFRVVWGVSANARGRFSPAEARRPGYRPRDDSEALAARLVAEHGEPDPADPALRFVGGDWLGPEYDTARLDHGGQAASGG
jgi:NAD(P)-dependent dehydrogenase (short-subunit alcohol dehydrogenase family)